MSEHPSALALESLAAGEELPGERAHLETCATCRAHVEALASAIKRTPSAEPFLREISRRSRAATPLAPGVRRRAAYLAGALALAAGLALFVRTTSPVDSAREDRLKGPASLAVIRDRGGAQERISGACGVRPGDRLRLEFAIAEPRALTAGVLTRQGEWLELEPPGAFEKGTHLSASSLKIDDAGLEGRALVGDPTEVDRARHGQPSAAVGVALEREATP